MTERYIRDLRSRKNVPPLFCKVVVDGKSIMLETRDREQNPITIYWADLLYQVKLAVEEENQMIRK